ncbi:hypothetical protein [Mobilicoccus pelagius]|nr:hypothetical protein [Mobilicoccus pelagius]
MSRRTTFVVSPAPPIRLLLAVVPLLGVGAVAFVALRTGRKTRDDR